ncbi:hypothetical protein LRS71_09530 [Rhodococcus pyridinivorans]|uniref:DUF7172 family protein n=1 Tax=Rhodococcus pyridinivorans TaxID=103816 RepID=UPI001E4C3DA3|nr:hypothetical protein [Rhodococcus pyridinivorans]MCD5419794.1 hypothetical protein [Rhodococcus pyridinivorans]
MSHPCVNPDDFEMVDGTHIRPREHLQWRHVATNYANGVIASYPVNDGQSRDLSLLTLQAQWTNPTPLPQHAYALLTRAGGRMAFQSQSAAYIQTSGAVTFGASPADPSSMSVLSRFGIGVARGATAQNQAYYGVMETRMGERSMLLGDTVLLPPEHTVKFRIELRFVTFFWEHREIHNGLSETEAEIDTGESQIDIFAYPAIS